jgi:hypothetical protein
MFNPFTNFFYAVYKKMSETTEAPMIVGAPPSEAPVIEVSEAPVPSTPAPVPPTPAPVPAVSEASIAPVSEALKAPLKKKRKRSPAQVAQLEKARKARAKKKKLTKPIKVERKQDKKVEVVSEFSWSKEILKVALVSSLGLASVFVQRNLQQNPPPAQVSTKPAQQPPKKKMRALRAAAEPKSSQAPQKSSTKDPFGAYRR